MKIYRFHPCGDQHPSWSSLAACAWPHATVDGDGPYAAASCGARVITLYATEGQAQVRKSDYDRDSCRPRCHHHHHVIDLTSARDNGKPPNSTTAPTRRAMRRASPQPATPTCGRPRTNGNPCRQPAGCGTDTPGTGPCHLHGGSITERLAAKERLVDQALAFAQLVEGSHGVQNALDRLMGSIPGGSADDDGVAPVLEVDDSTSGSLGFLAAQVLRRLGGEAS